MAAPTIYRSTDTSAPVISGQASALRLALNAILVDGYGSKAAAGWTKAYEDSGNHLVAYRAASGLQRYVHLDDSPTRVSVFRGYRAMTSISAGTQSFPSALQTVTPKCRKSVTADSTARPWICLATDNAFYIIIFGNQTTFGSFDGGDAHFAFGELVDSPVDGNQFLGFIFGAFDTSTTDTTSDVSRQAFNYNDTGTSPFPIGYAEGWPTQVPFSTQILPCADVPWSEVVSGGSGFPAYPDPSTGKLLISRRLAQLSTSRLYSGYFPGLWLMCHPSSAFTSMDTFSGSGTLAGRTFLIVKTGAGTVVFETTGDSW